MNKTGAVALIALFLVGNNLKAGSILSPLFAANYTVGRFATGLDFPVGMTQLADGSFLVGTTTPPPGTTSGQFAYYNGTGQVVRMTDVNNPGAADNSGTVIAAGLPGAVTAVLSLGNGLIAVSTVVNSTPGGYVYNAADITFLKAGSDPSAMYTNVGAVHFSYPFGGDAAALLPTVAASGTGQYTIYFGLNALGNDGTPGPPVQLSGLVNGQLPGGSLDSLTVRTGSGAPVVTAIANLATGIRNASHPIVDPAGNVYFGDNGYKTNGIPTSADEFDILYAGTTGVSSYGYPGSYTDATNGDFVGGSGIPPAVAFLEQPNGSAYAGIAALALAPASFPDHCIFAGFHGIYNESGTENDEDPLLCVDPAKGALSTFIAAGQAGLNHPDSLYSTNTSLFVENMFTGNFQAGTGEIDVITADAPDIGTGLQCFVGLGMALASRLSMRNRKGRMRG